MLLDIKALIYITTVFLWTEQFPWLLLYTREIQKEIGVLALSTGSLCCL